MKQHALTKEFYEIDIPISDIITELEMSGEFIADHRGRPKHLSPGRHVSSEMMINRELYQVQLVETLGALRKLNELRRRAYDTEAEADRKLEI